jgi:hypothetical protein
MRRISTFWAPDKRRSLRKVSMRRTFVAVVMVLCVAAVGASARPAARVAGACRVPRLVGLTLTAARERADSAGCKLRVKGSALKQAGVQTIQRQSPGAGGHASSVAVWLNPICFGSAAYGPGLKEPLVKPGPTKLISGFYLDGGPLARFSAPGCKRAAPSPEAGTVEVMNASGTLVATQTSTDGHFVEIPLPAGTYTLTGTFLDDTSNGAQPKATKPLVIPSGNTVRQDFFLDVP